MSQENQEEIQEFLTRLSEKSKSIVKKFSDLEKQILEFKANAEVRMKIIESESDRISKELSELDRRLRVFELNHDNRKERWNMAINFVIQLVWVAMAAFLLSKLGLQPPL